jgi:hypothetical protein
MRRSLVLSVAFLVWLTGCAESEARIARVPSSDVVPASPAAQQLEGTWHGSFARVGGGSERDEANCVLEVEEDSTFTGKCSRSEPVTIGVSRAFVWSGRVVPKGRRFVLQTTDGLWPSIALTRSGNDRLSGLTRDPQMENFVMMEFERAGNAP